MLHPLVYVAGLAAVTALASRGLWAARRPAFFDRVAVAVALGMLLFVACQPRAPPPGVESFECTEEEAAPEDTSDIDGLRPKLYSSVFGPSPVASGNWGKLHVNQERTSNTAEQTSADVAAQGFSLYNKSLHAPAADALGLSTTDRFTWVVAARFNGFSDFETTDLTTETLAQMETSTAGPDYIFKLDVSPGEKVDGTDGTRVGFDMAAGQTNSGTAQGAGPVFDPEQPYLIVVNRSGKDVHVRRYPLMAAVTSGLLGGAEDVLSATDVAQGLAASNQKVLFNVSGRLDMNAYAVALFDSSLSETQEAQVQKYFEKRIREAMDPSARLPGDCPYGADVCASRYCADIQDWSKPEMLIDSRSECKQAIQQYCEANPKHPSCYCWDTEDERHGGDECRRWRALIEGGECKAVESLSDSDLKRVKELYKLVDATCGSGEPEKPSTGITNPYEEGSSGSSDTSGASGASGSSDTSGASGASGSSEPKVSNYYKTPGAISSDSGAAAKAVYNPYTSTGAGSAAEPEGGGSGVVSNPYHDRPSIRNHDSGRLVPFVGAAFDDQWGGHSRRTPISSSSSSQDEPAPKSAWGTLRDFMMGD